MDNTPYGKWLSNEKRPMEEDDTESESSGSMEGEDEELLESLIVRLLEERLEGIRKKLSQLELEITSLRKDFSNVH